LFGRWLDGLRDIQAQARIAARMIRLTNGNFGDCKPVGEGVWELRVDWGPGYRVYYALDGKRLVLLCDGGDKRTQSTDIELAIERWNEWQKRGKK
jgi:putative addiction module killer protein